MQPLFLGLSPLLIAALVILTVQVYRGRRVEQVSFLPASRGGRVVGLVVGIGVFTWGAATGPMFGAVVSGLLAGGLTGVTIDWFRGRTKNNGTA